MNLKYMEEQKKFGVGFGVMVLKDGQVLLGRRHENPEKASSLMQGQGTWTMPGGKLDFGEKLADGACREALEECGLKIAADKLKVISISDDFAGDNVHFTTVGFLCEEFEGEPQVMEPDEIVEWKWFDLDTLPEKVFPPSKKVLENYKNNNLYQL